MEARCTCEQCVIFEAWQEDKGHILDVLHKLDCREDMLRCGAQRRSDLTKRMLTLRRLVMSLHADNSRSEEDLEVALAENESLEMEIATMREELVKDRKANEEAEVEFRQLKAKLEKTVLALQEQQKEIERLKEEAKAKAQAEKKRVRSLRMEVERTTRKVARDREITEAAVDECKKMAKQLSRQGLLTKELEEELASIIADFSAEQLKTGEGFAVDSGSEVQASDEIGPVSSRLKELLVTDEYSAPEPNLERCLSVVAEMKVPRALSPFSPSPVPLQPVGEPLAPKEPLQPIHPSELAQSMPVMDPMLPRQGPGNEFRAPLPRTYGGPLPTNCVPKHGGRRHFRPSPDTCKAGLNAMKCGPSTWWRPPLPKKRRLTIVLDDELSDKEGQRQTKTPLLSKREMHQLFSSDSSSEAEDMAEEEEKNEQGPSSAFARCPAERAAAPGKAVLSNIVQGGEGTGGTLVNGPVYAGVIGAGSESQPSQRTLGSRTVAACPSLRAASSKPPPSLGNPNQAKEDPDMGRTSRPTPAAASRATCGNPKAGGVSPYRIFLRSAEREAVRLAAISRNDGSYLARTALLKLAYFATQQEVNPKDVEVIVDKLECDDLVQSTLNYMSECTVNPVSAYCRGEQKAPLITGFETLLLQALEHKRNGWVTLLHALRIRFWSRLRPQSLMGRAAYLRLISALCAKLDEPKVAQALFWDLLGTNQAPFLAASVVGAWPGLLKTLPPGILQKTIAYLLLDSPAHTLNSTLEFQARQVLRTLGPLHGFVKYIPRELAEELLSPLLPPHQCSGTLWRMYKNKPKALFPLFTALLAQSKKKNKSFRKKFMMKFEGTQDILRRAYREQEASMTEPAPQEDA